MAQSPELANPFLLESDAETASLTRGDSVKSWGVVVSVSRSAWAVLQSYLDVVLGAVLLLAGALKGQQLLMDPSAGRASGVPRELLIGAFVLLARYVHARWPEATAEQRGIVLAVFGLWPMGLFFRARIRKARSSSLHWLCFTAWRGVGRSGH